MFKHDDEDPLIGLLIVLAIIVFIVYIIFILAAIISAVAGVAGTAYGGGYAIKNYASSFKENVIDSNKAPGFST